MSSDHHRDPNSSNGIGRHQDSEHRYADRTSGLANGIESAGSDASSCRRDGC
jgi:hypothetical protein